MRHDGVWSLVVMCGGHSSSQPRRQWRDETMTASHKPDCGMKFSVASIGALIRMLRAEKTPFLTLKTKHKNKKRR